MTSPVLSPKWAAAELDRVLAKAVANPANVEHWFQLLPEGSRDLLAFSAFTALVESSAG